MALKNSWIGLIERDYYSAKTAIINKLSYLLPEMTDHTEANPLIKTIDIFCGILEQTNYYIDTRAREVYLSTLRRFTSALKIASSYDYRVKGVTAATVDLKFFVLNPTPSPITIPAGTEVKTKDNIQFFTISNATINTGELVVTVPAVQRVLVSNQILGTSDGTKFQQFEIAENVEDGTIQIIVDANNYTPVDSFITQQSDDYVFIGSINKNVKMAVEFGDGINGVIPPAGQNVICTYYTSSGALGNKAEKTITEIVSVIPTPTGFTLFCENVNRSSGGSDIESIDELRKRIPKSIRTNNRAVTNQDYIDIAEMVSGVASAGINYNCGKTVDVYVAPNGGGTASNFLLRSVNNYFETRRMVTTKINALSAGDVRVLFVIDLVVLQGFNRAETVTNVKENLKSFLSTLKQKIKGTVALGNVYEVIENTPGVESSEVKIMSVLPFALPRGTSPALNWDKEVLEGSIDTNKWTIKMNSPTTYLLFRNNSYLGVFNVGQEYTFTEIKFTVNSGAYTSGNMWDFVTYKAFGTFTLIDNSIATTQDENITINATGGI